MSEAGWSTDGGLSLMVEPPKIDLDAYINGTKSNTKKQKKYYVICIGLKTADSADKIFE